MTERPILFSGPMVRALLADTKTQTRRICKPQPHAVGERFSTGQHKWLHILNRDSGVFEEQPCPYGQPGDRLWVKETYQYADWTEDGMPWIAYQAGGENRLIEDCLSDEWGEKLADIWAALSEPENFNIDQRAADRRWRPSIHMPRWASRITLEIAGVRVERLQDISQEDAIAEGIKRPESADEISAVDAYRELWLSINGPGSWDANPWVWVVEFKRISGQGAAKP